MVIKDVVVSWKWLVSCVGVVLMVAGCSSTVPGTASVNDTDLKQYQADHGPLNARDALGDLSTVDYCSMVDVAGVGRAGASEVGPVKPMWNQCMTTAKVGGRNTFLILGLLVDEPEEARVADTTRKLERGLVAQTPAGATRGRCVRYLGFADGPSLEVDVFDSTADTLDLAVLGPMCAVTDALFAGLTANVLAKKVTHFTFTPGSLSTWNACSTLSDAAVSAEFGRPARRMPISTGHRCVWNSGANWVDLDFDVSEPIPRTTGVIAGRPSLVAATVPVDCGATTVVAPHAPGAGAGGGQSEIARVFTVAPSGRENPCAVASALAGVVWPRLPQK